MKKRPQTAKKKVGFALKGTKIEAPDMSIDQTQNRLMRSTLLEFKVEKAKEFESFKNIPRFSHAPLAVIHPSPTKPSNKPKHIPPSSLAFDSSKVPLKPRRSEHKNIPEHLVRPPIDEEKLMKIKAQNKMREE